MKNWQFYALQCNLLVILGMVVDNVYAKIGFMLLAIAYLIGQVVAMVEED
jgi:hypothetical protein